MKISVIIPMYNVEKYIERCVLSVINTVDCSVEYEILIIDDASPDNSLEISKKIAEQYLAVKIISQENKGLGGARNTGILAASGDYLLFLDSDDYVNLAEINSIINLSTENELDVLEFTALKVNKFGYKLDTIRGYNSNLILSGQEFLSKYGLINSACNKLYRRKFLIENSILFIEKIYIEDLPFNVEVFLKAGKVMCVSNVIAFFYQNNESITRAKRTYYKLNHYLSSYKIFFPKIVSLIEENCNSFKTELVLKKTLSVNVTGALLMLLKSNLSHQEKKEYLFFLNSLYLYPFENKTGIKIRDLFIDFVNIKFVFNTLLFFSSFKFFRKLFWF